MFGFSFLRRYRGFDCDKIFHAGSRSGTAYRLQPTAQSNTKAKKTHYEHFTPVNHKIAVR
jgi:hypothetical protein